MTEMKEWWGCFRAELGGRIDPMETARRLQRRLRDLEGPERQVWLDRILEFLLAERRAYGVCLFLLEGITDPGYLRVIARHLEPMPARCDDDDEGNLADLIRVLGAADDRELLPAVEHYLLRRDLAPAWSTVPWALWPHRKALFTTAWNRYFSTEDPAGWHNTLVVRSFLTEPEAIRLVRGRLEEENSERWELLRAALLRQAGSASWLSSSQRAELEKAVR